MGWQADGTRAGGLKMQPPGPGGGEGALGPFFPGRMATTSEASVSDLQVAPPGSPTPHDLAALPNLSHHRCVNLGASWILP